DLPQHRLLVLEMQVDGGRRVLDARGDLAHGDRLVALVREQLAGRVQDLRPQLLALSLPSFLGSQTALLFLTLLIYLTPYRDVSPLNPSPRQGLPPPPLPPVLGAGAPAASSRTALPRSPRPAARPGRPASPGGVPRPGAAGA